MKLLVSVTETFVTRTPKLQFKQPTGLKGSTSFISKYKRTVCKPMVSIASCLYIAYAKKIFDLEYIQVGQMALRRILDIILARKPTNNVTCHELYIPSSCYGSHFNPYKFRPDIFSGSIWCGCRFSNH